MEKLVITNFLSIDHAEIEIKKINLFIGPQAQGKSLISKLIYFFKEYPRTIIEAVQRGKRTKVECDKFALDKFEKIFPKYTWRNDAFRVDYSCSQFSISIANAQAANEAIGNAALILTLESDDIFITAFNALVETRKEVWPFPDEVIMNALNAPFLEQCIYIPAARSLLVTLENKIYALISSDVKIDYLLLLFGKYYEDLKDTVKIGIDEHIVGNKKQKYRIEELVKKIIVGNYLFENNQSWIIANNRKTNITDVSSGQQEALPMVFILSILPYLSLINNNSCPQHFIIEEPEAHLFPVAQNDIVLLIANAYNFQRDKSPLSSGHNFFTIATHSPYILTAFNNLIQAGNVAASMNNEDLNMLRGIVPESEWVDFNDVAAYVVNNGTAKSILNHDLKLIDANMIDDVSNSLSETFTQLLHMEVINE